MARRPKAGKKRGNSVSINWGEAELNNFVSRPGTYPFEVESAEENDNGQIVVTSKVTSEGRQEGKSTKTYFGTEPNQLWVLRNFLEAVGEDIPDEAAELDLDGLVGKEFMATIEEDTYDGKTRLRIAARSFESIDDADEKPAKGKKSSKDDDDEDEKPKGKKNKKPSKVNKEKVEEMDRDELEELISDMNLDTDPDDHKRDTKLLAAVLEELEEKELLEDEADDEEEEKPQKRGRGRPKGSKNKGGGSSSKDEDDEDSGGKKPSKRSGGKLPRVAADDIAGMDEEELDDLIVKYDLEFDDDQYNKAKTLRKKAAAVIEVLEERNLLDE